MLLIAIAAVLGGAIVLAAVYVDQSVLRPQRMVHARLAIESAGGGAPAGPEMILNEAQTRIPFSDHLALSAQAKARMALELRRAGLPLKANEYLALRMGIAFAFSMAAAIVARLLRGPVLIVAVASLGALLLGWWLPAAYVARRRERRKNAIEKQLPEALTAVAKSLRAGSGLLQALKYAAAETPPPLGAELQQALHDLELGGDTQLAFEGLIERTESSDLAIVSTAIMIQRTVGGNLSEILTNVTKTIRERAELRAGINVLTARQRLTGNLVALLPVLVAAAFVAINRDMGSLLFTTAAGRISLAVGIGFELLGLVVIRRLGRIEV